jgi:hypothetical protein
MSVSDTTFSGYSIIEQEQVASAWNSLQIRSEESLSYDSVFTFYNSEILKWEGLKDDGVVSVANGLFYRDITAVRSDQSLFDHIQKKPSAFVLMNILVTADNKIILGRRTYYGDWPNDTFECPGSFLKEKNVAAQSLVQVAKEKVQDDYLNMKDIASIPFMICNLPRVMETMLLCVSKTSLISEQIQSDFYTEKLVFDNSQVGYGHLQSMDTTEFHPPSRVALQAYFDHFDLTQELLAQAD